MVKIVLLVDVLEDIKGGAERQVYELIKGLDKEKFAMFLFVLHQNSIPQEILDLKINTRALGIKRIYDLKGICEGIAFKRFLFENKIDVVMTYHFASDIWGAFWGRKAPLIVSNRRDIGFWRKGIHGWAYRFANRWVDRVVVNSEAGKKQVICDEGVSEQKIQVIRNGIDLERFSKSFDRANIRKGLGILNDDLVVCCVGNLREIKGQKYLVEAGLEVLQKLPNTRFVFVGDGPLRKELEFKVQGSMFKEKFLFLGKKDDVPEILSIADVCVLPSLSEGLSNAILEYMAAGKPVIATNVGGNSELVENEINGILVEPANSKQLAEAMNELLESSQEREAFGKNARNKVEKEFALDQMIKAYEHLFNDKKEFKVLHLISSNGLYGAEKVLLNIAANMNGNGVQSLVVSIQNSHNLHFELLNEAKKRNIPVEIIESKGRFDGETVNQLIALVRKQHISIIHSHNYKADFVGYSAARKAGIPIVATNHLWTKAGFKLRLYEFFDGLLLRKFNKVVAVSEQVKKDMLKAGVSAKKITVIDNGVPCNEKAGEGGKLREEFGVPVAALVVGCIARLSPEKGHAYLLEAAKKMVDIGVDVYFILFGEGPLEEELKNSVKAVALEKRVLFAGFRNDMENVYSVIDILVQPSLREGLPLSLLEAMGNGKAVIATSVGAVPKLVTNMQTGLLIKPGSVEEIILGLKTLVNDAQLRDKLASNAKAFVKEHYSLEKMVASYREVYSEVVSCQ